MAYQAVHIFTITTCSYIVMVDFAAGLVKVEKAGTCPGTIPSTVTEAELGAPEGYVYVETCIGLDQYQALAIFDYPFAEINIEANSVDCGYTPPDCSFTFLTSLTNTTNGGNNGKIEVTDLSVAGSYQYSLDNVIWQSSPIFNFLFSGTYNVYVRRTDGCLQSTLVVLTDSVTPPVLPPTLIPYQFTNRLCLFFRLIIAGITHSIREPIKWNDVNIIGERDEEFHGYQFKYSDGNFSLGFDCDSGRELIEAVYNLYGQDGDISFHFGYSFEGTDYYLFRGQLMLNTYKWFADHIECTVQSDDVDTVFTSRLDTKVSMTATESFDGDPVPTPTPYNIELHAKEILTKIYEDSLNKTYTSFSFSPNIDAAYIKPDNTEVTFSETEDNFQYPLGDQTSNPVDVDEYIVHPQSNGVATLATEWNIDVVMNWVHTSLISTSYSAQMLFVTKKFNTVTGVYDTLETDITDTPVSGFVANNISTGTITFNISGSISSTQNFLINDALYIYVKVSFTNNDGRYSFGLNQSRFLFDWQYLESTAATNANGWFLQDVIQQCLNVISNNHYALSSSFVKLANAILPFTDGCGSKYILTNGFQIRQFDIDNRPLKIELKKVFQSINAQFCIGYNYNNDETGASIRIERRDYFYQDRQILAIEFLQEYREEVAIDIIYNELEHGYTKYQDSGFNSLDEFNTKASWLTPIKKNKKKLPQLSDFIASGYAIEACRRNQFAEKPSSSVTNDEEPFIVSVKRTDSTTFETEKNEAFETVTGIISPETSYNLRISPARLLYNWFIWLKGIVAYKTSDDTIKNTNSIQNNDLITRFLTTETCRVGDENRSVIDETAAIRMQELNSTADIYRPERVFIKCRLNPVEVQTINLAMTGRYGDDKDYGYILVKKPTGIWQAFWLQKLSYNFATERAELSGLMKFISPAEPDTEDCCMWLNVNGCYLLVNDEKIVA